MSEKMMFIFSRDEIERIKEVITDAGKHLIMVDMHGLRAKNARTFLKNLIALDKEGYDICVIHGYNHGTAIKEIIYNEHLSSRIVGKKSVKGNLGRTILEVQAA